MSKQDLERVDDLVVAGWDTHSPETFAGLFADEFVLRDLTVPEPIRTKDGAAAYTQSWFTAFPDLRVHLVNRVIGEDSIASEVEFSGTNTGPWAMGDIEVPPTSRRVNGHGAYFARVKDGKVVEFSAHPDAAGMMMQLGLVPQP